MGGASARAESNGQGGGGKNRTRFPLPSTLFRLQKLDIIEEKMITFAHSPQRREAYAKG
jgi:hypothetical protein